MKVKRIIIATSLVVTFAIICAMSAMALQNSNKINNCIDIINIKKDDLTFKENRTSENTQFDENEISVYTDIHNNEYFYNHDGKMIGFMKRNTTSYSSAQLFRSTVDIKVCAENFLKTVTDIDNYVLTENLFSDEIQSYILTYYRYINGYKTSDFIVVFLDVNGEITSYAAPYIGVLSNMEIPQINEDEYINRLVNTLNMTYGYGGYSYTIADKMLTYDDSEISFTIFVEVTLSDGNSCADIYSYPIS